MRRVRTEEVNAEIQMGEEARGHGASGSDVLQFQGLEVGTEQARAPTQPVRRRGLGKSLVMPSQGSPWGCPAGNHTSYGVAQGPRNT